MCRRRAGQLAVARGPGPSWTEGRDPLLCPWVGVRLVVENQAVFSSVRRGPLGPAGEDIHIVKVWAQRLAQQRPSAFGAGCPTGSSVYEGRWMSTPRVPRSPLHKPAREPAGSRSECGRSLAVGSPSCPGVLLMAPPGSTPPPRWRPPQAWEREAGVAGSGGSQPLSPDQPDGQLPGAPQTLAGFPHEHRLHLAALFPLLPGSCRLPLLRGVAVSGRSASGVGGWRPPWTWGCGVG